MSSSVGDDCVAPSAPATGTDWEAALRECAVASMENRTITCGLPLSNRRKSSLVSVPTAFPFLSRTTTGTSTRFTLLENVGAVSWETISGAGLADWGACAAIGAKAQRTSKAGKASMRIGSLTVILLRQRRCSIGGSPRREAVVHNAEADGTNLLRPKSSQLRR